MDQICDCDFDDENEATCLNLAEYARYSGTSSQLQHFVKVPDNYHYSYSDCEDDINENYKDMAEEFKRKNKKSMHRHNDEYDGYDVDDDNLDTDSNTSNVANGGKNSPEDIDNDMEIFGYNDNDYPTMGISIENAVANNLHIYKECFFENNSCFNGNKDKEDEAVLSEILLKNESTREKILTLTGESIKNLPEILTTFLWVEEIVIINTNIEKLENLPPNINTLVFQNNNLELFDASVVPLTVKSIKFTSNCTKIIVGLKNGYEKIDLSYNNMKTIDSIIPSSVVELRLTECTFLKILPVFEDDGCNMKIIDIYGTSVEDIDSVPDTVEILNTCKTNIKEVNKLPSSLKEWKTYNSTLNKINCALPNGLTDVDFCDCFLKDCPDFPLSIKMIDLAKNLLEKIPSVPDTAQQIDVRDNKKLEDNAIKEFEKTVPNIIVLSGNAENFTSILDLLHSHEDNDNDNKYFTGMEFSRGGNSNNSIYNLWRRNSSDFLFNCSSKFSDSNPHYIKLTKTYTL
jgi:hypothetical protein